MTIPDPATFIGQSCVIAMKDGRTLVQEITGIDTGGVHTVDEYGERRTYAFRDIDFVKPATEK